MPASCPRPFTRLDGAILLVALLLALPAASWSDRQFTRRNPRSDQPPLWRNVERPRWFWAWQWPYRRFTHDLPAALLVLTVGAAVGTFRRPRALGRRTWRAPGVVALVVGTAAGVLPIAELLAEWASAPPGSTQAEIQFFNTVTRVIPGAILGAWVVLALDHRRRPRVGWPDRLGRVLGWCWLWYIAWPIVSPALWG